MTFSALLNSQISILQNIDFCARILFAIIAGGIIGNERSHRFKDAGIRTHAIVCCTTALLMIISKYGFVDLALAPGVEAFGTRGADSSRIAAQAVSGISFLCAGVIFKVGSNIRGLTTAAGIWLTAGIGLAIGAGMYPLVIFTMLVLFAFRLFMKRFRIGADYFEGNQLQFVVRDEIEFDTDLRDRLKSWKAHVTDSTTSRNSDGTYSYNLTIRREKEITYAELREFVESQADNLISVSNTTIHNHVN